MPSYPLPIVRLARLAADARAQGRGVGESLMRAVFMAALEMRERLGCVGVVVDAKPDAVTYYSRFGFIALEAIEGTLEKRPAPAPKFLPVAEIARALGTRRAR